MRALGWCGALTLWVGLGTVSLVEGQEAPAQEAPEPPAASAQESSPRKAPAQEIDPAELLERIRALEAKLAEVQASQQASAPPADSTALPAELAGLTEEVEPDLLKIYGFFDTGMQYLHFPDSRAFLAGFNRTDGLTFQFGGMNLYFDAQPHEQFRALVETRLSLWPHGQDVSYAVPGTANTYERTDTSVFDGSSTTGRNKIQWSGIMLERAWAQWQPREWFNVRTGLFLTPYGIWNVDHGMPTLISMVLPSFFASEYFPTRQIGIEVLGMLTKGYWDFGYHLTASNGRNIALVDVDSNKAFGGRIYARHKNRITIGASWYWDQFKDVGKYIARFVPFQVGTDTVYKGTEYALAVDFAADVGNFRFRTEGVMNRIEYTDGYHKPAATGPTTRAPNEYRWNGYALLAYTRPDLYIEPYVLGEFIRQENASTGTDGTFQSSVGLNLLITPRVSVKNQVSAFHFVNLKEWETSDRNTFYQVISRLVMAF